MASLLKQRRHRQIPNAIDARRGRPPRRASIVLQFISSGRQDADARDASSCPSPKTCRGGFLSTPSCDSWARCAVKTCPSYTPLGYDCKAARDPHVADEPNATADPPATRRPHPTSPRPPPPTPPPHLPARPPPPL